MGAVSAAAPTICWNNNSLFITKSQKSSCYMNELSQYSGQYHSKVETKTQKA